MLLGLMPTTAFAEGTGKAIQLGTSGILGYDTAKGGTGYDYIYMGSYNSSPVKWRVLDDQTNFDSNGDGTNETGLFLLSEDLLGSGGRGDVYFDGTSPYSNAWQGSDAQAWCNTFESSNLDSLELAAILATTKSDDAFTSSTHNVSFAASTNILNSDQVFFLSAEEAVNSEYGFTDDAARIAKYGNSASTWWLRSPYADFTSSTGLVDGYGRVYDGGVGLGWAARPAFNLNLNSVLFTSAAVGGKPDGGLTTISEYSGNEWKLTLKDSSRSNFAVTSAAVTAYTNGSTVEISYTGAKTGANEYISALLVDDNGNPTYYGRSNAPLTETDGTAQLSVPAGFAEGNYMLKVFNEQYNGNYKTDYASDFTDISLTVKKRVDEQFSLTPGGRYYFDLSGESIPGTANSGNSFGAVFLPDTSLHYVPFIYAGTIEAYKLTSAMATTEEYAQQYKYAHSLFVADYVVTNNVSWDTLNTANLIFGKDYASGGVDYTLRAPSVGSDCTGLDDSQRGVPQSNEWDTMLNKDSGYIQNWNRMFSWGQDVSSGGASYRAVRGYFSARFGNDKLAANSFPYVGFRPVLEVLNPDTLGSGGLKVVTLDLNGGKLGGSSEAIQIIVKNGSTFTAPMSGGLTRPDGNTGSYFMWLGSDGKLYAPGASVPADVTKLTAQWRDIAVPTGEIKIAENGWKSFFNTITFDLFFKDTQMVTVTAADNSGEAVTVEYLLSDKALTESELAGMTFTAYSAPFSINPDNKYVIYAKLTDTSGNVAYINTNGIVLDATVPGISGIEAGKIYCAAQTVTVTEKYIGTVKVNGTEVSLDENSQFALSPASGEQTIVVTDKAGNETKVTVTVNDGHTYEWQSENGQYWQKCKFCNHETAKKDIPTINISGADKVCRTQDYKFSFTLPEGATDAVCGYEFIGLGGGPLTPTVENGLYSGIIKASTYPATENSFKLIVSAKTADGFAFSAEKKVTIQNEHTGGTATCKDKAICEVCGESYGKLDPNNHANLKHIDAKAATKTSEGNIEYWYCDGCNKYYKDAKATQEITKAQTVTAKLPPKITAGDGATVTQGEKKELSFTSDASFADFLRVELDGTALDEKNYTKREGSTIITLNRDFVATLSVGEHTLSIVSKSGTATAKFTVKAKPTETTTPQPTVTPQPTAQPQPTVQPVSPIPRTGDAANPALWFALLIVSGFALAAIFVLRRKDKRK